MNRALVVVLLAVAPSTCISQTGTASAPAATLATTDTETDAGVKCGAGTVQVGNECVLPQPPLDPLVGAWANASGALCDFFPNRAWNQACLNLDGWARTWDRIGENRYVFESTYRNCLVKTEFADDGRSVRLHLLHCGASWLQPDVTLVRVDD